MKILNKSLFFVLLLVSIFGISYDYAYSIDKKNSLINVDESSNAKIYNVAYTTDKYFIDMLEIIKDISYEDKNGQIRILKNLKANEISYFIMNLIYDDKKQIKLIISKKDISVQGFISGENVYYYFDNSYVKKINISKKYVKLKASNSVFDLKMLSQTMQFDKIPKSIDILLKYQSSNNFMDKIAKFFKGEKSDIKDSLAVLLFVTEYSLKFHNILNSSIGLLTHKNRKEKIIDFEFYIKNWNFYNIKYFKKEKEPVYILNIAKEPDEMQIRSYSLLPFYKSKYKNDTLKELLIAEDIILNEDYKINNIKVDFETILVFDKIFFENKYFKDIEEIRSKYNTNIILNKNSKTNTNSPIETKKEGLEEKVDDFVEEELKDEKTVDDSSLGPENDVEKEVEKDIDSKVNEEGVGEEKSVEESVETEAKDEKTVDDSSLGSENDVEKEVEKDIDSKVNEEGVGEENLEKPRDDASMKLENDRGQDQNNSEQLKVELNESNEDENSF